MKEELGNGIVLFETRIKNTDFLIAPVADLIQSVAEALGFSKRRVMNIRLSCEEMLTERIINAYTDVGNVEIRVLLMPEYMRVGFLDSGMEYDIHRNEKTNPRHHSQICGRFFNGDDGRRQKSLLHGFCFRR